MSVYVSLIQFSSGFVRLGLYRRVMSGSFRLF